MAVCMGMVDFSGLSTAQIVSLPQILPIKPTFNIGAIISVLVIFLVSATETIGDTSALASSGLNREVSKKELTGSIAADGFVSALSGLFGCLPITSFSQNVGLVSMTKDLRFSQAALLWFWQDCSLCSEHYLQHCLRLCLAAVRL